MGTWEKLMKAVHHCVGMTKAGGVIHACGENWGNSSSDTDLVTCDECASLLAARGRVVHTIDVPQLEDNGGQILIKFRDGSKLKIHLNATAYDCEPDLTVRFAWEAPTVYRRVDGRMVVVREDS